MLVSKYAGGYFQVYTGFEDGIVYAVCSKPLGKFFFAR